jgi:hypothetical protein
MNQQRPEASASARPDDRERRRPYHKPRLTEYGSIAKLTQGTRTVSNDGPGGGFKMTRCL